MEIGTSAQNNSLQCFAYPGGLDLPRSILRINIFVVHYQKSVSYDCEIGGF